uniref:Putative secreted protein n=1 Tax=Ixodes ricinus TaxID=34613 RepID=A0A6B0TXI8_IXORI
MLLESRLVLSFVWSAPFYLRVFGAQDTSSAKTPSRFSAAFWWCVEARDAGGWRKGFCLDVAATLACLFSR